MKATMTLRSLRGSLMALCTLLLLLWLLPMNARAAEVVASGYCGGEGDGTNLTWTLDSDGTLTISGSGKMADYKHNTQPWNSYREDLRALVIEEGVTSIGDEAFYGCYGFTGELIIPDSVTSIGDEAFYCCRNFTGSLIIPDSVTSIGSYAFQVCHGFTGEVELSEAVSFIGYSPFCETEITAIKVSAENSNYTDVDGVVFSKDKTEIITAPGGISGECVIPSTVTRIGDHAFYYCRGLTGRLTIPNSVTSIGNCAFSGCTGFTGSLTIPDSVASIGDSAFRYCYGFTGDLIIGNGVTSIGDEAFYCCWNLTGSLIIGNGVTSIGDYAFRGCRDLTGSLTIPGSVTSIGDSAFWECTGFTGEVEIPESLVFIGDAAFSNTEGITAIKVAAENPNYTDIDGVVFSKDKTEIITAPGGISGECVIPSTVTRIGDYAFYRCTGLTGSLTIPNSVTSIGNGAFYYCTGLTGSLTIGNSVTSIGSGAFSSCSGFTGSLVIPDSVTSIGDSAFWKCTGFTGDLTIGNGVTSIGDEAFYCCEGFTGDLIIGNGVTSIGCSAFIGCPGLSGNVYFCGSAPTLINKEYGDPFDEGSIFYYIPGTIGWTDSEYYDADNGTWNGYALKTWDIPAAVETEDRIRVVNLSEETQTVIAAFYDASGRMTAIRLVEASAAEDGSLTIAVPADRQGDTWKIMLLDGGFLPVADALTP